MPSKDEQLLKDVAFDTTARDAGVTATLQIRLYDNDSMWAIGDTPRNSREEVLADVVRVINLLEQQSSARRSST